MTRRAPILVLGDPELISSGLAPDRHSLLLPLWEIAENVRFYQGKVRRLVPSAILFDDSGYGYFSRGLHQQQNSDGVRWIWQALVHLNILMMVRWYGAAAEHFLVASGGTGIDLFYDDNAVRKCTQIDITQWGDWTIVGMGDPGTMAPLRYQPSSGWDVLPNAPACLGVMKKQNQLMAIGTGLGRRGVAWSDADDITDWTPTASNLAGSLTIEELKTPIRAFARLGQNIAVYTEDQMALVYWTGAPFYFGQRVALDGIGCGGKAAVCTDGRLNYGMGRNGCWQTDGSDFRYIDQGVLSDYLQENVNWDQSGKIVVARNDVTRCIEFHFPKVGSNENNEAWSFDPSTGGWSKVRAFAAMSERLLFDKPITSFMGQVHMLDENPAAAAALALETKPLLIDTPDYPGFHVDARIDEIEIAALKATNVEFQLRNATDIDGPWESTPWQVFATDLKTYRLPALPTGTYHKVAFRSTADNWDLDLQALALFGAVEGTKRDNI